MNVMKSTKSLARTIAVLGVASIGFGCAEGLDLDINAPILEAAGINLSSKKVADPDLPERSGLVMPPSRDRLPEPGERTFAADNQSWPSDPDQQKKTAAAEAAEREKKYCREGDWSGKGGISEFNKNIGVEQRCRAQFVKDAIKKNEEANNAALARNAGGAAQ